MVEKIKQLAKNHRTNIAQIEKNLELSQGSIRHWDTKPPAYDKLLKVAKYFHITIEELVDENSEKTIDEINLIYNYHEADQRGKEVIISIAALEAQRSKEEREEEKGEHNDTTSNKVNISDLKEKRNKQIMKEGDDEELKPFA